MSIQKKNGKYVPVVYLGKDPITGKKINKWGHYREKKKDAVKEEAEMQLSKQDEIKTFSYKDIAFKELFANWYNLISFQKYSAVTRETQMYLADKHILPIFGDMKLKDIETIHIQKFVHTKKELSPGTQRKIIYLLKNIFGSAVAWNMLTRNPCDNVILPKITKKEKATWTPDQIKSFLHWNELKDSKYYPMLLIAFHTGMRPGEITGLKWENINFKEKALTIAQGLDKKREPPD